MNFEDFFAEAHAIKVKKHPWMEECSFVTGTRENLEGIIDHCLQSPDGHCALDLETTGLDTRVFNGKTVDTTVGVCLCPDGKTGYYIPLAHKEGAEHNVPWALFVKEFQRLVDAALNGKLVFDLHGGNFDMEFLEFNGDVPLGEQCWDKPGCWDDTEILAYLENPRRRNKQLKVLSEEHCGVTQIRIHELWGHDTEQKGFSYDFSQLDPSREDVTLYGGGDGIATYRLRKFYAPKVLEQDEFGNSQKHIYTIEKACIVATRWMRRNRIHIDRERVRELIFLGQAEWFESIQEVYTSASEILGRDVKPGYYKFLEDEWVPEDTENLLEGQLIRAKAQAASRYPDPLGTITLKGPSGITRTYPKIYDINAPQQLGQMFEEMQVPGLHYTDKSGQVKTAKEELDRVVKEAEDRFPFMSKIKRFREISKALSNYLLPMLNQSEEMDDTIAINFRGQKVDTGRFATPAKGKKIQGWPQMNLQSIPASYDPGRPECMRRLRECIVAPDEFFIVGIDYAGVELRLVTNLSREPKWLTEYFRCSSCAQTFPAGEPGVTPDAPPPRCPNCGSDKIGDLHTLTALSVYGEDAAEKPGWKQLRQAAKAVNFALCYGGGGSAVVRACGVDKNEGWRIKRLFDETYSVLQGWWAQQIQQAQKQKYVMTAYGRKYPVPDIDHKDGGFRSKAERNAVNGPIQGTSADITKLSMALIYKECKKRGWLDLVRMTITMHDELVFEIHRSVLEEAIEVLKKLMTRSTIILNMKWPVPLTSDVEIGHSWMVPWDLNSMRAGEVRFKGNKKYKKPEEAAANGLDWESLSSFPEDLAPYFKVQSFGAVPSPSPSVGAPTETPPNAPPEASPPAVPTTPTAPSPAAEAPPAGLKKGDVFRYILSSPLTLGTMRHLARVILRCRDRGTKILHVVSRDGTNLTEMPEWAEHVSTDPILVNEKEFFFLARDRGL